MYKQRHAENKIVICLVALLASLRAEPAASGAPAAPQERMVEWTMESAKQYADPFNDVDVDVLFSKGGRSWRVPTFWRGGQQWTVRFAPPEPGDYEYCLESTDRSNPDLNGHEGHVTITAYSGPNQLLQHGMLRVSASKRYFEHADGTPFYWLGDTWWTGLSDRLSWEGFQKLTADRSAKGFTIVQIVAGLVPLEELAPADPGFHNEGGFVWEADFKRINPKYFDYADRRVVYLQAHGIVPAIVGAWNGVLAQMGVAKMKQHWRYIIARYGAFPAFWIVGGEVMDPPQEIASEYPAPIQSWTTRGWTEVVKYIRSVDPYHHPTTVHEQAPPFEAALQDESLTDFDLIQSGHFEWRSIAVEVTQLNLRYARRAVTKPIVEGEIGYEKLAESHFEDFQRTAFWLAMLNGAAGHTYGANGVWEAYTGDKPLHRLRISFLSWEEGMNLPGSYQVGLGAKLLRQYPWWRFEPHPEWVAPRGTTLLETRFQSDASATGSYLPCSESEVQDVPACMEENYPGGEWKARHGNFRLPYAAGIPGAVRLVYIPTLGLLSNSAPTILGLEVGVRYHAYWWEPSSGSRIDLGAVERPPSGALLSNASFGRDQSPVWKEAGFGRVVRKHGALLARGETLTVLKAANEADAVASVEVSGDGEAGVIVRFKDPDHYIAVLYAAAERCLYLIDRSQGMNGRRLGLTLVPELSAPVTLSIETRGENAAGSVTDGMQTYTTPIVHVAAIEAGTMGVLHRGQSLVQRFSNFQVRRSPLLVQDESLQRSIDDAKGVHRGDLAGPGLAVGSIKLPGWDTFGRDKHILLDAYRPSRLPTFGDWVLVLDARTSSSAVQ